MAMKEWNRAIPFLEVILTARTRNHASRIQVEAYKKWVLVNLLADGQVVSSRGAQCSFVQNLVANVTLSPAHYLRPLHLKSRSKFERLESLTKL